MASDQSDKLVIWRIYDNRPGHDNQSRGLANALDSLIVMECKNIPAPASWQNLLNLLLKRFPSGENLPSPDLVIGAGHKTHLALLAAKRARGGKTIVIMRPTLPTDWFDLCLIPDHDKPTIKDNIFITHGALNTMIPAAGHDRSKGLILVGGPSRHYDWNTGQVLDQITTIIHKAPQLNWQITDSARTPSETRQRLKEFGDTGNAGFLSHTETPSGWVGEQLHTSDTAWVTADSISMIYESLTAGVHTGILPVPFSRENKITNVINDLRRARMITLYQEWLEGQPFNPPPRNFNEADRSAREILNRFSNY